MDAYHAITVQGQERRSGDSGVTPIVQGWTNARGLRGLGGPKPDPNFLYILIFQMLGVSHLFYSTADFFVNILRPSSSYNV